MKIMDNVPVVTSQSAIEAFTPNKESVAGAWLASLRSENTRAAYRRDLNKFFEWSADKSIDIWNTKRQHLDLWVTELEADNSPATISRRLASVSSFYQYAQDEEVVAINPAERVKRPHVSADSTTSWLSAEEVGKFITAGATAGARDHAATWLLALGLRVQELCDAEVTDIQSRQGHRVLMVTGKGGKVRSVVLPPQALESIDHIIDGRSSGPVIAGLDGAALNRFQIGRMVKRLARAAGLSVRSTTPHVLRHSAAIAMLSTTRDIRATQRALGHANASTTERYLHSMDDLDSSPLYAAALAYSS